MIGSSRSAQILQREVSRSCPSNKTLELKSAPFHENQIQRRSRSILCITL